MAENIKDCPTGHYCLEGSSSATRCPIGTFNPLTNGEALSACQDCLPGSYCSSEGISSVSGACSAGYFCKTKSQQQASETPSVDGNYGPCPVGHYCGAGTSEPVRCPPGTYNPSTKQSLLTNCINCSAGTYCAESGRSANGVACSAGFF